MFYCQFCRQNLLETFCQIEDIFLTTTVLVIWREYLLSFALNILGLPKRSACQCNFLASLLWGWLSDPYIELIRQVVPQELMPSLLKPGPFLTCY